MENVIIVKENNSNGLSTASWILGIIGFIFNWIPLFGIVVWILAILSIIFGSVGIYRASTRGVGMAGGVVGLIMGLANIGLDLLLKAAFFGAAAAAATV